MVTQAAPARRAYPDADPTLTAGERAAPFALPPPDAEPIRGPTRVALVLDGACFAEIHPRTGEVLAIGCLTDETHRDA